MALWRSCGHALDRCEGIQSFGQVAVGVVGRVLVDEGGARGGVAESSHYVTDSCSGECGEGGPGVA